MFQWNDVSGDCVTLTRHDTHRAATVGSGQFCAKPSDSSRRSLFVTTLQSSRDHTEQTRGFHFLIQVTELLQDLLQYGLHIPPYMHDEHPTMRQAHTTDTHDTHTQTHTTFTQTHTRDTRHIRRHTRHIHTNKQHTPTTHTDATTTHRQQKRSMRDHQQEQTGQTGLHHLR
eukprot:GDKI01035755.1.p2 GENE.GDKI01035755.1~~GDKI01035755.1.p2  ORF type:complete len:171 (-),score=44.37 GDKI01035755.1:137-649(-)